MVSKGGGKCGENIYGQGGYFKRNTDAKLIRNSECLVSKVIPGLLFRLPELSDEWNLR